MKTYLNYLTILLLSTYHLKSVIAEDPIVADENDIFKFPKRLKKIAYIYKTNNKCGMNH